MKAILAVAIMLMSAKAVAAERTGKLGGGVELGEQNGVTGKYWFADTLALAGGLGVSSGDLSLHSEYLWHSWSLFPKVPQGELGGHLGIGGRLREDELGIRPSVGLDYWFPNDPVELFLDGGPIIELTPRRGTDFTVAFGVRAYFLGR
jgi:hypothetical protein